eukprot:scaffold5584_cov76-Cyclotella_meneghiniana.AAC.13
MVLNLNAEWMLRNTPTATQTQPHSNQSVAQWTAKFETRNGFKTTRKEAAQEALTFDISMIPFEAALRRTQFNTTVLLVFAEISKVKVTSKSDES